MNTNLKYLASKGASNPTAIPGYLRWKVTEGLINLSAPVTHHLPQTPTKDAVRSFIVRQSTEMKSLPRSVFVNKGDTAVIVGTPYKSRVRELARCTGPEGRVLIIEPAPRNVSNLKPVVDEYDHVTLDDRAAWKESGSIRMTVAPEDEQACNFVESDEYEHEVHHMDELHEMQVEVDAETVDTILEEHDCSPDFLEVMVNGVELEVLSGAKATLRYDRPRILSKGHARHKGTGTPLNEGLRSLFEGNAYRTTTSKGGRETMLQLFYGNSEWDRRDGDVFAWVDDE